MNIINKNLNVALTGPRFSGKTGVAAIFKKIAVPVFDADAIVKYLINYDSDVIDRIRSQMGPSYLYGTYINNNAFKSDEKFGELLDMIEFQIFEAYSKFQDKHVGSLYTIFKSSLVFERNYQKRFDSIIFVFAPKEERISRYSKRTGESLESTHSLFSKEMSETFKNENSNFVIHNYQGSVDVVKQVREIDNSIVDSYFSGSRYIKSERFSTVDNHSHSKNMD